MDIVHWYALGALALVFTLIWGLLETKVYMAAGVAGSAWAYMAVTADTLTRQTTCCTRAVGEPGLQYFTAGLAGLSFLAMILHYWGHYPPNANAEESELE